MADHPGEYRWSSYPVNAQGKPSAVITPHAIYDALGSDAAARQAAYRELFRYELEPGFADEIRSATNGNYALGNDRFTQQVSAAIGRRVVPGRRGRPKKIKDIKTLDLFGTE